MVGARENDLRLTQKGRRRKNSIDSIDSTGYFCSVSTTLTIRNMDKTVKQKLRVQAARHQRSMEAEARAILRQGVENDGPSVQETLEEASERLRAVIGMWKERGTTDELMKLTRGEG